MNWNSTSEKKKKKIDKCLHEGTKKFASSNNTHFENLSLSLWNSVTGLLCVWETEIETETENLIARFALEWKLFESKPPSFENRSLGNNRSSLSLSFKPYLIFFNQYFVYFRSSIIPIL